MSFILDSAGAGIGGRGGGPRRVTGVGGGGAGDFERGGEEKQTHRS